MDDNLKKILIIDDSPANIKILGSALSGDYQVIVTTDSDEALLLAFSDSPPDLILLDIMMPKMDGYEVCRTLKADARTRDVPIIFITAKTEVEDEAKGFELGAADYITKPFSIYSVKARVKTHIELSETRKKLEDQNAQLEQKVKDRTEQLLKTQKEMLTLEHEATLGNILAGAAHDFSNLMSVLLSYTMIIEAGEKIQQEVDTPTIAKLAREFNTISKTCKNIGESVELGITLCRGIVDFATGGNAGTEKIRQPAEPLVKSPVDIFKRRLIARRIKVVTDFEKGSPIIKCNGGEIQRVILNLVSNAIDAMDRSKKKVLTIKIYSDDDNLYLAVADTGVGIEEDDIERVFENFYSTKVKEHGSGIGLFTVKRIIDGHNGSIVVESQKGDGSEFIVSLPRHNSDNNSLVIPDDDPSGADSATDPSSDPGSDSSDFFGTDEHAQTPIDYNSLREAMKNDDEAVNELIRDFLKDSENWVTGATSALNEENCLKANDILSNIECAAVNLMAIDLAEMASNVTKLVNKKMFPKAIQSLAALEESLEVFFNYNVNPLENSEEKISDNDEAPINPSANISILLVDDSASMRKLLKMHLNAIGFHSIIEAVNGKNALEILEETSVDLIISDWSMPTMTGIELLTEVRSRDAYENLPFIMVTAEAQNSYIDKAVAAKVSDYIVKPFKRKNFAKVINKTLYPDKDHGAD